MTRDGYEMCQSDVLWFLDRNQLHISTDIPTVYLAPKAGASGIFLSGESSGFHPCCCKDPGPYRTLRREKIPRTYILLSATVPDATQYFSYGCALRLHAFGTGVSLKEKDTLMKPDPMEIIQYHNLRGIPADGLI